MCSSEAEKREKRVEKERCRRERFIHEDSHDIIDVDIFSERRVFREVSSEVLDTALKDLQCVESPHGCFRNT
jgi:hypothetical protein